MGNSVMELSAVDVSELSRLLGYNLKSPNDLIRRVIRLNLVSVGGVEMALPEGLMQRMKSRALNQWGPDWIRQTVLRLLSNEVGF